MTGRAVLAFALCLSAPGFAAADDVLAHLVEADAHLESGEYDEAVRLTEPYLERADLRHADRAEALRIHGLALFHLGDNVGAEKSLLAFLRLEPEAHLDPKLVAPEAIVFFEDIRARHAGELMALKKRPKRRRYLALVFVPPFGQFQNGDRAKAWALTGIEVSLLATNITTFWMLRDMCNANNNTCSNEDTARSLRTVNLVSAALLAGVWVYGTIDGYVGYRRESRRRETDWRAVAVPLDGGFQVVLGRSF